MGNTFTHYTGNDKFQINSTSDIYAFALVGLTSQITYSLDSDWEASGEGTADGKYVYIFRHKPNAVRTASTFLDALVFTLISGSIPNDSTVHWVNGTTASYDGTQNSLTPFSGVTYNIEYSSTNAGSGSGDPHIVPLFNPLKRTYMLPTDNLIYKYFDNLDPENRVVINAKMWVLSNRYIGIIENLKKKESPLLKQAAKRIPEFWLKKYDKLDTSFMRYISVINGDERLIIDLEHLGIVGASDPSMLDKEVDDLTLEPTPAPSLNKIKVTGIQQYHRGIWAQKMIKMDNDNQNTFFRDIYIHTEKHGRITLRLVRMLDRYNHRTHLEMSFDDIRKVKPDNCTGVLISADRTETVPSIFYRSESLEINHNSIHLLELTEYKAQRRRLIKKERRRLRQARTHDIRELSKKDPEKAYRLFMSSRA